MLDRAQLQFLGSPRGADLLREAAALEGELLLRLTRLRKQWSAEEAAAALELLELRRRAASKFSRAGEMFFTRQGLEQASGDIAAEWRAKRFPEDALVLDLCCGIGGDAVALSRRGRVYAFDADPAMAWCAQENVRVHGCRVEAACADVTRLCLKGDAAFFDPSRRSDRGRTRKGDLYSPPLEFYREIRCSVPNLAVKVSPAVSDLELQAAVEDGARVEFVSVGRECREAVLWFGSMGPDAARSASLADHGLSLTATEENEIAPVGPPGAWILDPDPSVVRGDLVAELCRQIGAWRVDAELAYLSSESRPASPFVRSYRLIEWLGPAVKPLKARLRSLGLRATVVKRRGAAMDPEEAIKRLETGGGEPATVIFGRVEGRPAAMICGMLEESG